MKPTPFRYVRADSMGQVLALLEEHGDEAKILAGGQSLIPTMNMRFAAPELLLDVSCVSELQGCQELDGFLRIGAMCRHVEVLNSPQIKKLAPLISMAMPHVAHLTIRNQGTFGGSMCQADPASELPACTLALDARFNIESASGKRVAQACDFFQGIYTTCLADDEVLVSVDVPYSSPNSVNFFQEFSRRHGDYAIAGLAARAVIDEGCVHDAHLVFFGVAEVPISANSAERLLCNAPISSINTEYVCNAIADSITPLGDLTTSSEAKLAMMQVLMRRALDSFARQESAA